MPGDSLSSIAPKVLPNPVGKIEAHRPGAGQMRIKPLPHHERRAAPGGQAQ
jgi:hypothetical protein